MGYLYSIIFINLYSLFLEYDIEDIMEVFTLMSIYKKDSNFTVKM